MPYVQVRVAGPLTREQKEKIASEFSETLEKIASKPKKDTYIVFEEVSRANWAVGDKLLG